MNDRRYTARGTIHMSGMVATSAERWLVHPSIKLEGTNARISQRALVRRLTLSPAVTSLVFEPFTADSVACRRQVSRAHTVSNSSQRPKPAAQIPLWTGSEKTGSITIG